MGASFQHAVPLIYEQYKTDKRQHFKDFKICTRYGYSIGKPLDNEKYTEREHINTVFCEKRIIKKLFYFQFVLINIFP